MMKNLIVYTVGAILPASAQALDEALQPFTFIACGKTQPESMGFVAPRAGHGALVESINGHWLLAVKRERRILPPSVIADYVEELAAKIEDDTGRKPRGKARKELQEQALQELLPRAFTVTKVTNVWIDPAAMRVVVGTGTEAAAESIVSMIVKANEATPMNLSLACTQVHPAAAMASWLLEGTPPDDFSFDREGELKQPAAEKAVIRYQRHPLDTDEVKAHVRQGKEPTRIAMTYKGRVAFVLCDSLTLKRVTVLDIPMGESVNREEEAADAFDADFTIFAAEASALISGLYEALGGLYRLPIEAAAMAPQS